MKNNFYTKTLCALLTFASMGIVAEINTDDVINHIATITDKNNQELEKLQTSNWFHLRDIINNNKDKHLNNFQAILNTTKDTELQNALIQFYGIAEKEQPGIILKNPLKEILEKLYMFLYKSDISKANVKTTQKISPKKKLTSSNEHLRELLNNASEIGEKNKKQIEKLSSKFTTDTQKKQDEMNWQLKLKAWTLIGLTGFVGGFLAMKCYNWYKR